MSFSVSALAHIRGGSPTNTAFTASTTSTSFDVLASYTDGQEHLVIIQVDQDGRLVTTATSTNSTATTGWILQKGTYGFWLLKGRDSFIAFYSASAGNMASAVAQ